MANIKPFSALRPAAELAAQVASLPYDVMNRQEAKKEAMGNPISFLHITRSEINLPDDIDAHTATVYNRAKENLTAFISRNVLFRENKACYYIYQLTMNGRSQTGLVTVSSLADYDNDIIKKHEFTRPEKELDRINHMATVGAQTGNVFLAYKNVVAIDNIISKWQSEKSPVYDFTAPDNIRHAVWVINDNEIIESITTIFSEQVPCTYIADGHHRAASAAKVRDRFNNNEAAQYFLTTLFPSNQLQIMDYNRVVKDLNGLTSEQFLQRLQKDFEIELIGPKAYRPGHLHEFGMYFDSNWYKLSARSGSYANDPISILDVSILQNNILDQLFGIKDPRTDKRIDFVGGIRGLEELENRVNSSEMKVAFSLFPVSIEQLFTIADSGNVMPPKSTWFEPKLRDGLLTHIIDN